MFDFGLSCQLMLSSVLLLSYRPVNILGTSFRGANSSCNFSVVLQLFALESSFIFFMLLRLGTRFTLQSLSLFMSAYLYCSYNRPSLLDVQEWKSLIIYNQFTTFSVVSFGACKLFLRKEQAFYYKNKKFDCFASWSSVKTAGFTGTAAVFPLQVVSWKLGDQIGQKSPQKQSIQTGLLSTISFPVFFSLSACYDSSTIYSSFSSSCSSNTKTYIFRSFCIIKLIINIVLISQQQQIAHFVFMAKRTFCWLMMWCVFEGFILTKHIFMLNKNDSKEGLLQNDSEVNSSAIDDRVDSKKTKSKIRRDKEERSEVTYILKILNLVVGGSFLAFSVFCYMYGFEAEDLQQNALILRYVMPAYIGISGVIIIAIECRIGFVVRNMRFFYNYFGRGIFNVYAGVMPLTLISNFQDSLSTFEIVTLVASSVMTLVGVLYICLKIFCCEKEGDRIDQANRSEDSD